jgi:hypothetical protein
MPHNAETRQRLTQLNDWAVGDDGWLTTGEVSAERTEGEDVMRGLVYGTLLSLPIWGVLGFVAWLVIR